MQLNRPINKNRTPDLGSKIKRGNSDLGRGDEKRVPSGRARIGWAAQSQTQAGQEEEEEEAEELLPTAAKPSAKCQ